MASSSSRGSSSATAVPDPSSTPFPNPTHPQKIQRVKRSDGTDVDLVTFPPGDPEDPRNWPSWRKWLIIESIILVDLSVSWGASGL